MSDDLVERVARTACASVNSADTWDETGTDVHEMVWFPIARAAIAVCMEEAASYCEMKAKHYWGDGRDCCDAALQQTAAAIRALVKEPQE